MGSSAVRFGFAPLLLAVIACDDDRPTSPTEEPSAVTAAAASPLVFAQLSAGYGDSHTCGITTAGKLYCWGSNIDGSVGDGTTTRRLLPVPIAPGRSFRQVSAGRNFTCAVTTDNQAFCWGNNSVDLGGNLGDGSTAPRRLKPVAVLGGHAFRQVSAGSYHTCGVTTDDRAWCWGTGAYGELGEGTSLQSSVPVRVAGTLRFRGVSVGTSHSCGVTTDDRAYCWGRNKDGEVGDSTRVTAFRPVRVAGGRRFRQVDAGASHTCGVTTDGRAYCWGYNLYGQIGDGRTTLRRLWPARTVTGDLVFRRVEGGGSTSCGVTTADVAYCWGYNGTGALGDGTTTDRNKAVPVGGVLKFAAVTTGGFHSCGRTTASRGYCWGDNFGGALGDGTRTSRLLPRAIAPPAP